MFKVFQDNIPQVYTTIWESYMFFWISVFQSGSHTIKQIQLSSMSALFQYFDWSVFLISELLTDRPAAEAQTAVYSWDEQRGKPVLTGHICSSSFLEPPTAIQQSSDCLTLSDPQTHYRQQ